MPVPTLDTRTVTDLVADATTAPSMHNAQPWKFRFHRARRVFDLRADPERTIPRADPTGRALHLGCGAALFNLRVAAAHAGWQPQAALLPEPADPDLLATVHLAEPDHGPDDGPDHALAGLYPVLRRRHTSRYPFAERNLPEEVRNALREAAEREGAQLVFPAVWHVDALLDLVHDAEERDARDPTRFEDIERWTRLGTADSDTATDGLPEYALGPRKRDGKAPVRDFAGRHPVADRGTTTFEHSPHLALLGTTGDSRSDWLRAGQAMERVLLVATRNELATSLSSHSLEWADLRQLTRDPQSTMGSVQMVLRLGYGPAGPATPRRPVREVLDIDDG